MCRCECLFSRSEAGPLHCLRPWPLRRKPVLAGDGCAYSSTSSRVWAPCATTLYECALYSSYCRRPVHGRWQRRWCVCVCVRQQFDCVRCPRRREHSFVRDAAAAAAGAAAVLHSVSAMCCSLAAWAWLPLPMELACLMSEERLRSVAAAGWALAIRAAWTSQPARQQDDAIAATTQKRKQTCLYISFKRRTTRTSTCWGRRSVVASLEVSKVFLEAKLRSWTI